ncbi:Sex-lethal -like protein [Caligus rogercresseyi]|uniref:Sex-lethal -like protein n=1 Tax=Caligus rogercresseyi TaxID=217165 RepID=A0A7T8H0F4_CALRO|nr:Sex-lethal -like protein [Caligus rogercresseyi]
MTDKELFSMFVTCGPLIQARIIRDRKSGYSYGYGFVHYESPSDATRAIETLSGLAIQNKTLKVSYARPNSELIKDSNLYVANLGQGHVLHLWKDTHAHLLKDPQTGIPKGVAFVRFSKQSEARDAISALNGTLLNGQEKPFSSSRIIATTCRTGRRVSITTILPRTWVEDPGATVEHDIITTEETALIP